jgi:hypothetical protein
VIAHLFNHPRTLRKSKTNSNDHYEEELIEPEQLLGFIDDYHQSINQGSLHPRRQSTGRSNEEGINVGC